MQALILQHLEKLQSLSKRAATAPSSELVSILAAVLASQGCVGATSVAKKEAAALSVQLLRERVVTECVCAHNTLVDMLISRLCPAVLSPEELWALAESVDNPTIQAAVRKRAARDYVTATIRARYGAPTWCDPSWATHWQIGGRVVRVADHERPWYSGPADLEIAIGNTYASAHLYLPIPCGWERVQEFSSQVLAAIDELCEQVIADDVEEEPEAAQGDTP